MPGSKVLVICLGLYVLSGCAAMGVLATSDPNHKLSDACSLINVRRPLPAERLIVEALEIFKANGDKSGVAKAYLVYGLLLQSDVVKRREKYYREYGFRDKTVNYDNRYTKSVEYFEKAKAFYTENKKYDLMAVTYFYMGKTYQLMNNPKAACAELGQSLENSREFLKDNPNTQMNFPTGYTPTDFKDFPGLIDAARKEVMCDAGLDTYNKLLLEVKSNDTVNITDSDKERIARAIISQIKQKAPNRFGELGSQALHVVIILTKYYEETITLSSFLMPGYKRTPTRIEADVMLENYASKDQLSKRGVTTTGGGFQDHPIVPIGDVEVGFIEDVVVLLLRLVGQAPAS